VEKYYTVGITANSNNSLSNVRFTAVNFDICNYLDRHPFELSNVNVARCEVLSVKTVLARPCGNLAQVRDQFFNFDRWRRLAGAASIGRRSKNEKQCVQSGRKR
jgi:hypothetical protein